MPIFAVTEDEPTQQTLDRLAELHAVVVPRAAPVAALDEVLGVLFPIADTAERSG
jgi:hypothetical protein